MQHPAGSFESVLALADDPLFSAHRAADAPHPERPERLEAARAAIARADLTLQRLELQPRDASDAELLRVHEASYLEELGRTAGKQGWFDPDTYYCGQSAAAARRAAGAAVALVDGLLTRQAGFGVGLLRPPGHHARPGRAMGFCLLNNVAVAAAHARAHGAERVMVLDWDVHHGNGTQEMFYGDPSVLYVSLHEWPFYPGSGARDELGRGEGRGFTVNLPLSAGADDAVYVAAFERIVAPITELYGPDLVLVSAGFDAHVRDPLAGMCVTDAGYAAMLERILSVLPGRGAGRVALVLEGGYDLRALASSLLATLRVLDGQSAAEQGLAEPSRELEADHEASLERAAHTLSAYWKLA